MMSEQNRDRISCARLARGLALLSLAAALGGCAVGPDRRDPLEKFNRGVAEFNDGVDAVVLKPAATAYRNVLPPRVRTGVSNFVGNLTDGWSAVNSALQLKIGDAAENFMRVNVNTVLGLGGLIDIASELNIERHREDFGQTLGRWGVPAGPYLVLPLLGPSTVRDTVALPVDGVGDPLGKVAPIPARNSLYALRLVNARSNLLRAGAVLDSAAIDKYSFTRDAYLQRRRAQVDEAGEATPSPGAAEPAPASPPARSAGAPETPPPR